MKTITITINCPDDCDIIVDPQPPIEPPEPSGDLKLAMRADGGRTLQWYEQKLNRKLEYVHLKLASENMGFAQHWWQPTVDMFTAFRRSFPDAKITCIFDLYPTNKATGCEFENIAAGRYDNELRRTAQMLIDTSNGNTCLRLWHEFDMPGKNWGLHQKFIPAWRRVVSVMNSVSGANFEWQYDFIGAIGGAGVTAPDGQLLIEKAWPGKDYVTEVGIGLYDRNDLNSARKFAQFSLDFAISKGVPFSWAEGGLWGSGGALTGHDDNPSYIQMQHDFMRNIPDKHRGYLMYFEVKDEGGSKGSCLIDYPRSDQLFQRLYKK